MATFYGYVKGTGGPATRLGHKDMIVRLDGWNLGVEVLAHRNLNDTITFQVYRNCGSSGGSSTLIAEFSDNALLKRIKKQIKASLK